MRALLAGVTVAGVLLARPAWSQGAPTTLSGVGVALSGDLLTVSGTSIRLYGIAAPMAGETCETRFGQHYDCYRRATDVLQTLIGTSPVSCTVTNHDRTGQAIGVCRAGGSDLAAAMAARGWAFAYRRLTPVYVGPETFAQSHRLGMWAGRIETAWQWRSRHLSDSVK